MSCIKISWRTLSIALCLLILIASFVHSYTLKGVVVTFDKARVVQHFVRQMSAHALSETALSKKTALFGQTLTRAMDDYAHEHHVIVLAHSSVLAGSNDITDDVMERVSRLMREQA